jgi:hypothetical protein
MQPFSFIGANDERAVPRFTVGFRALKLRTDLFTGRGRRPFVS